MAKSKITKEYIKSLLIRTNKLTITVDKEKLFSEYAIVSYSSNNKDQSLAYEHLATIEFMSVTGIFGKWDNRRSTRFFILCTKEKGQEVKDSLQKYNNITARIDRLEGYDEKVVKRIVASLAINALGKKKNHTMMYNGGCLLICDEKNFCVKKRANELVALRIEVTEDLTLAARTNTFSTPKDKKELLSHRNCVFALSKDIDGYAWSGKTIKPVVTDKNNTDKIQLSNYYIKKKIDDKTRNIVPYWPYGKEKYTHGRLFAICDVVRLVNEQFHQFLKITFTETKIIDYDACRTKKPTTALVQKELQGCGFTIKDPFKTDESITLSTTLKEEIERQTNNTLEFHTEEEQGDLVIKFCEEIVDKNSVHYERTKELRTDRVLQHYIYSEKKKTPETYKTEVQRILLELMVKNCLRKKELPDELATLARAWKFFQFKEVDGLITGANLSVISGNLLKAEDYGFDFECFGEPFNFFCKNKLGIDNPEKIKKTGDYRVMTKKGNVYLIEDTEVIPMLSSELIDEGYGDVINKGETVALFKRIANVHNYLRGFIGLHYWKIDGLNGEKESSYSYIAGKNISSLQIKENTKMDKMPRARRIHILRAERMDEVDNEIKEILDMLKWGFGRWDELMTYPFMFKFLSEYLDNESLIKYDKHWDKLND